MKNLLPFSHVLQCVTDFNISAFPGFLREHCSKSGTAKTVPAVLLDPALPMAILKMHPQSLEKLCLKMDQQNQGVFLILDKLNKNLLTLLFEHLNLAIIRSFWQ